MVFKVHGTRTFQKLGLRNARTIFCAKFQNPRNSWPKCTKSFITLTWGLHLKVTKDAMLSTRPCPMCCTNIMWDVLIIELVPHLKVTKDAILYKALYYVLHKHHVRPFDYWIGGPYFAHSSFIFCSGIPLKMRGSLVHKLFLDLQCARQWV
jgi:hypothetical protein